MVERRWRTIRAATHFFQSPATSAGVLASLTYDGVKSGWRRDDLRVPTERWRTACPYDSWFPFLALAWAAVVHAGENAEKFVVIDAAAESARALSEPGGDRPLGHGGAPQCPSGGV